MRRTEGFVSGIRVRVRVGDLGHGHWARTLDRQK